jgi:hypothetical protein
MPPIDPESQRLADEAVPGGPNWKRWGPYLAERQWATVREDATCPGDFWHAFPFEQAAGRAYRWGEDGLLGFTDRECRLCLAPALWNGRDPILKERLYGLTNPQGNHGEDVKEVYFYLDGTPTHSYAKALYKYPQAAFPYAELRDRNATRSLQEDEFEVTDTGVFDGDRYFDVTVEYAKDGPNDILMRITVANRGPDAAPLHVLPSLWFRNTWTWGGDTDEAQWARPRLTRVRGGLLADHETLGRFRVAFEGDPEILFTENDTNPAVFADTSTGPGPYKDAFHAAVVSGNRGAIRTDSGTKAAGVYKFDVPAGGERVVRLRLSPSEGAADPFADFDAVFAARQREADQFYATKIPAELSPEATRVSRQAYAGLLWSEQFYFYVVPEWLPGDPAHPLTKEQQERRINRDWKHLYSRDVLSVPDTWEYPAFFAWDTAFHMVAMCRIDAKFAKGQLLVLLREWYLHPNGQLPAYEYDLSNVDPPVHAWACWEVYRRTGGTDHGFLERAFHKLLMNFTWWVNRKDPDGRGVFSGGFLGMDNLGVFDRSATLPGGGTLEQADGTAWMGFYCTSMLRIAIELAVQNRAYEDIASKFFEHFVAIADSLNNLGGKGLWDEGDGFYYDQLWHEGQSRPLKCRAMIGLIPLLAVTVLDESFGYEQLPEFRKRVLWFLHHRRGGMAHIMDLEHQGVAPNRRMLLALTSRRRLERVLRYVLDETEFLSDFGVRSLSAVYRDTPYTFSAEGVGERVVRYVPGASHSRDFGGNSNWRGPIWMPINYLLVDALRAYHDFYGDFYKIECPTGSGVMLDLKAVAGELSRRLSRLFLPATGASRPCHGEFERYADDPHWKPHLLFHEYFDGDTGRGLGASHQTGWTALITCLLNRE